MKRQTLARPRQHVLALALVAAVGTLSLLPITSAATKTGPVTTATTFISLLSKGNYSAAARYFSPSLPTTVSPQQLQQIWTALIAQLGAYERQTGTTTESANGIANVIVSCVFARATADLVISIVPDGKIGGFHIANIRPITPAYTPPDYVNTASFRERAVTIGKVPWTLPGALTLPQGHGPFPAVVLVAGSGPEDRDETIGGNRPFRDIAWGLASQGIAVLRYDKRTLVYGAKIAALTGFTAQNEFVDDALAAVQLLARTPNIDRRRIYLLGHSEGAMMAPLIAQRDQQIAGLAIMAGPTRPLEDVIVGQIAYLQSRGFATAAQVAAAKQQAAAIKALTPADRTRHIALLGVPPSYWLSLQGYHPAAVARTLKSPLLIMQAARDYQVTMDDFSGWKTALTGHPHVSFKVYANLFHLFIPVPAGSPAGLATPIAYQHPGHVDRSVVHDIATWLKSPGV